MTQMHTAGVAHRTADDLVLPFRPSMSGVNGRLVRLGPLVDQILSAHDYPEPVSVTLGQALALAGLLGTALKFDGRLILQTKTDGPLGFLVADFDAPTAHQSGGLRGYAAFDRDRTFAVIEAGANHQQMLLGSGHLAMTIDPGRQMDRYQGIVSLENDTLETAAQTYFRQSEQLPTFLKLAVARHFSATTKSWHWRAGGLLLQYVSPEGGHDGPQPAERDGEPLLLPGEDADDWRRAVILARTVEDHELLDPMLAPERLLYRLFHEEGVRTHDAIALRPYCRCSRERVENFLKTFGSAELADMRESDGAVAVTCEFCSSTYRFKDEELV